MDLSSCDEVREALWPDPDAAAASEARAHFARCPACRRFFAWQALLGDRLARVRPVAAPLLVRGRLRLRMAAVDRARRWRPLWITGLAAAALALAALMLRPDSPAAPFTPAATYLAAMPMPDTADRMAESARLSRALSMELTLPEIAGAQFVGADLVEVSGAMWAGARYNFKGMTVAYFALPMDGMEPDSVMTAGQDAGWEVAIWAEPDGMRALAGEHPISRDELMAMALECRSKAMLRGQT